MYKLGITTAIIQTKLKYLVALAVALLAPIGGLMVLVGLFIIFDTIFGIVAAKKSKEKITSKKLSSVIYKMLTYQVLIIVAYMLDVLILGGIIGLFVTSITLVTVKVVALMLIINETFSIDEKIRKINNGKGIWYQFKRLIGVARIVRKETKEFDGDLKKLTE